MYMKVKGVDLSKLKKGQQASMKKHSVYHTSKHLRAMRDMMMKGKSFSVSHKEAQKKVGK